MPPPEQGSRRRPSTAPRSTLSSSSAKRLPQELREPIERTLLRVAIEVCVQILHVDLAADPLPQERDVRADHRAQIHQLGGRLRKYEGQERCEGLARKDGLGGNSSDQTCLDDRTCPNVGSRDLPAETGNEIRKPAAFLTGVHRDSDADKLTVRGSRGGHRRLRFEFESSDRPVRRGRLLLALHVDATAEVRSIGDRDSWSHEIPFD